MSALGIYRNALTRRQAVMRKRRALWAAMRIMREFTAGDIVAVCEIDKRASVQTYISQLRRAGFVSVAREGNRGRHEQKIFRIVRNTGPLPPALIARGTAMFDPNTEQEYSFEQ
jgi:hypothetical protein